MNQNVYVMIPARIGSKGIPKKVLRPLGERALIDYSITNALELSDVTVFVNTDSHEISDHVERNFKDKVKIHYRSPDLATDDTDLDTVAMAFVKELQIKHGVLITLQPTSPFLGIHTLKTALNEFLSKQSEIKCLVSVVEKRKLTWKKNELGQFAKDYSQRLNRQYLKPTYEETGAFVISDIGGLLKSKTRFNHPVQCFVAPEQESIDIDTPEDWAAAKQMQQPQKIIFFITANKEIGSGHLQRCLSLAHHFPHKHIEIHGYDIDENFALILKQSNYRSKLFDSRYSLFSNDDLSAKDVVVTDILDTSVEEISGLQKQVQSVISFEDLGGGAEICDLVINELYPSVHKGNGNIKSGPEFCILRSAFLEAPLVITDPEYDIVISFGGTDPNDLTIKAIKSLENSAEKLKIRVILGIGAQRLSKEVAEFSKQSTNSIVATNVRNDVAYEFAKAKIGITGGGRTVHEFIALGVTPLVLCQNSREQTHLFFNKSNGVYNLGLHSSVSEIEILDNVETILHDKSDRTRFVKFQRMVRSGAQNVVEEIENVIRGQHVFSE